MWEHFCEAMFPGMLAFKAQIDARGKHELPDDQEDMWFQAHVDYHLCECLLQDSAFFRWNFPNSPIWRALEVFQDPTTPFMQWHHDTLTPWVRQLQRDADRCHASIRNMRGGRTVLDTARSNLGIEVASTLDQSRALLQEMVRLLDAEEAGSTAVQILPAHPPPPPPVPDVFVPVLRISTDVTAKRVLVLRPLWDLWETKLRQYYSPLLKEKERKTPPAWEGRDKEKFQDRKDMLELDAQISEAAAKKKGGQKSAAADRELATQQVLTAWHARMREYRFTAEDRTEHVISLTPTQVAKAFKQGCDWERGIEKFKLVQLKVGTGQEEKKCEIRGSAADFLKAFRARI